MLFLRAARFLKIFVRFGRIFQVFQKLRRTVLPNVFPVSVVMITFCQVVVIIVELSVERLCEHFGFVFKLRGGVFCR